MNYEDEPKNEIDDTLRMKELEDIDWQLFHDGDREVYSLVYTFFYKRLFNYGIKFGADKEIIEDSIQDVFLYFWNNKVKIQNINSFHSYIIVSFRNGLLQRIKKTNEIVPLGNYDFQIELSVEDLMIEKENMAQQISQLNSSLQLLTARQKEIVFLKYYEGLSFEEISIVMDITTKATYKLLARAIAELRMKLGPLVLMVLLSKMNYYGTY